MWRTLRGMAIFHRSKNTPPKSELIEAWLPKQPWGSAPGQPVELLGSYHLDDPEGEVGLQTHIVRGGDVLFQVPLTYRAAALEGAEHALVGQLEHSVLGTRWVHDGLHDPQFVLAFAAVAITGVGQALGMASVEGRWYASPDEVKLHGQPWDGGPVAVDGFSVSASGDAAGAVTLVNDRFVLTFRRRLTSGPIGPGDLAATWPGQDEPIVLAEVQEHVPSGG